MAHHFTFAEKDTTVSRGTVADSTGSMRNKGADEILEVGKEFQTNSNTVKNIHRSLIKFDITKVSQSIVAGDIPASAKYYLVMYDAGSQELQENQTLYAYAVSQSWQEGSGFKSDSPQTEDGASWKFRDSGSVQWHITSSYWGGTYYSSSACTSTQSFNKDEPVDMRMDVTSIINKWLVSGSGDLPNEGFIIKRTNDDEQSTTRFGISKFFSADTHTVFAPKLEVVWDSSVWSTGSLSALNSSDLEKLNVSVENLKARYKVGSVSNIRVCGRERYPAKTFSTSSEYITKKYLPSGSSFYSIVDAKTNHVIVPFGDGSKLSCDSSGNYFDLRTQGLYPERFYKINFKIVSGSGINRNIEFIDDDRTFKVER